MATDIQKTYYQKIAKVYKDIVVPAEDTVVTATNAAARMMTKVPAPMKPVQKHFFTKNTSLFTVDPSVETISSDFTKAPIELARSITIPSDNIATYESANKAILNKLRDHLTFLGSSQIGNVVQTYTEVLATFYLLRVYFVTLVNILASKVSSAVSTGQTQDAEIQALKDHLIKLQAKNEQELTALRSKIDAYAQDGLAKDAIIEQLQRTGQISEQEALSLKSQLAVAVQQAANAQARGEVVQATLDKLRQGIEQITTACTRGQVCPKLEDLDIIAEHINKQKETIESLKELIRVAAPLLASFNNL